MAKPINDEHALLCGMVWGIAMRHGIPMNPMNDADGDYSDTLELVLPEGYGGPGSPTLVRLTVLPAVSTTQQEATGD